MIGTVVMVVCCWGCAALFFGIGLRAGCGTQPMNFWAGIKIDPQSVSDIPAYNRKAGRMWMVYSVPYWLAGVFSLFVSSAHWCAVAALILIVLACFPGLWILMRRYQKIANQYISRETLDKLKTFC